MSMPPWPRHGGDLVVGAVLRDQRARRGWTVRAAARAAKCDSGTVRRVEIGSRRMQGDDDGARALIEAYGLSEWESTLVRLLVQDGPMIVDDEPGWPQRVAACERVASTITSYSAWAFPPYLSTPAYAAAVRDRVPHPPRVLPAAPDRTVTVLLEEAVLRRPFGDRDTLAAQLRHAMEAEAAGTAVIRVVRLGAGPPAAGILSEMWWQPIPLYVREEPRFHATYYAGRYAECARLWHTLEATRRAALPPAESARLLAEAALLRRPQGVCPAP
jgi:transcriptional regulator with XRE-family HTH domain